MCVWTWAELIDPSKKGRLETAFPRAPKLLKSQPKSNWCLDSLVNSGCIYIYIWDKEDDKNRHWKRWTSHLLFLVTGTLGIMGTLNYWTLKTQLMRSWFCRSGPDRSWIRIVLFPNWLNWLILPRNWWRLVLFDVHFWSGLGQQFQELPWTRGHLASASFLDPDIPRGHKSQLQVYGPVGYPRGYPTQLTGFSFIHFHGHSRWMKCLSSVGE